MNEVLHVTIEGMVQGVGFRHTLRTQASKLGLSGWVRNIPDGRVEAKIEGPREALDKMLVWCHKGPALSKVIHVNTMWGDASGDHTGFSITF